MTGDGTRVHFVDHDGTEQPATFESWDADDYAWLVVDGPNTQHYTIARYSAAREPGTWHHSEASPLSGKE